MFGVQIADNDMNQDAEDIFLARKIAQGDAVAFRQVYDKYSRILYSMVFKMLKDESQASNIVQSVFVKLWESRKEIVVNISLKNYLYAASKHYVLNFVRNRNVELRGNYRYSQMFGEVQEDDESLVLKEEKFSKLTKAINELPSQQARVVKCKSEGMKNQEIASEMGISVTTVKYHYSEALKTLRKLTKVLVTFLFIA